MQREPIKLPFSNKKTYVPPHNPLPKVPFLFGPAQYLNGPGRQSHLIGLEGFMERKISPMLLDVDAAPRPRIDDMTRFS